jgi:hypothetical protein
MLVATSDYVIPDAGAFRAAVQGVAPRALPGDLVISGITASRTESGYGYLDLAAGADPLASVPQTLSRFVEAPDLDTATQTQAVGNFLWNAGILLFTVQTVAATYRAHVPNKVQVVTRAMEETQADLGFTRLAVDAWRHAEDISTDYATVELADNLVVMTYGADWSVLGRWDAVRMKNTQDADGNVCSEQATAIDCKGSLSQAAPPGQQVIGIGLQDTMVVARGDAVLVPPKADAQRVKEAVSAPKAKDASQGGAIAARLPPVGLARKQYRERTLPSQTHRGASHCGPFPTITSPPARSLDRGQGHGPRHFGLNRETGDGKPIDLFPAGCCAPDANPR